MRFLKSINQNRVSNHKEINQYGFALAPYCNVEYAQVRYGGGDSQT